jgi:predicted MFS family arabinose efflux permease
MGVLRQHADFRRLWLGQVTSAIGDRMVVVVLALYVTERTGDPAKVGVVLAAYTAPLVILLLLGGVWADRLPRQRIMIATDLIRFALHAVLAALIITGAPSILLIALLEAAFGAAEAFFRPAYTGLVPQTVPEDAIQAATAITSGAYSAAELLGPAIGTVLFVLVGSGWAYALDASTFLVSAVLLVRVRARVRGAPVVSSSLLSDLRRGFREVRSRSWVWVTVSIFSLGLMIGLAPWITLGPTVARDEYGAASFFGVLSALWGAGNVVGALIGLRWRPLRPMRSGLLACLGWPAFMILFGLGAPRPLVIAGAVAAGLGIAVFAIVWETSLAQRIPPQALSRVSSYDWMGSLALIPIGYLGAGLVAQSVDPSTVVLVGGIALVALIAIGLTPRQTRTMRRLEPEPDVAVAPRPQSYSGVA